MKETSYDLVARFYDGAYRDQGDAPFYLDLARDGGGPVLEIGCGTGRVLLPIARAGLPATGFDRSRAMLDILAGKLAEEPQAVRERVDLQQGDMRGFDLGREFRLVTVPFRPFQHMISEEDQVAALRAARRHLRPSDGRLALDVFYPRWEYLREIGREELDQEWTDPDDPDLRIERYFVRDAVHRNAQVFEGRFIYRLLRGGQRIEEIVAPLVMSYFTYPQMRLLFRVAGLEVMEEYGSFDKGSIADGGEMIFVLRRGKEA